MDARRVAAILATVGAGLWLSQALLLVLRGGVTPNAQIVDERLSRGFAFDEHLQDPELLSDFTRVEDR